LSLVPPASNNGITTLQALITSTPTCTPLSISSVSAAPNILQPPN
jgi:hypothetical protein